MESTDKWFDFARDKLVERMATQKKQPEMVGYAPQATEHDSWDTSQVHQLLVKYSTHECNPWVENYLIYGVAQNVGQQDTK